LTFKSILVLILKKSVTNIQNSVNIFFDKISDNLETASASAYSQARLKLSHTAFIELNDVLVDDYYENNKYKKYKGHRVLATDGSKIELPDNKEIKEKYGKIKINTTSKRDEYCSGLVSSLFDCLNHIVIDSKLSNIKKSEQNLALKHLEKTEKNDLIIYDRGYLSYELFAKIIMEKRFFLCRTPSKRFKKVTEFMKEDCFDKIVELEKPKHKNKKYKELPEKIKVRLVKVILESGEIEILITNLLNNKKYKTEEFSYLYWLRWEVETFYGIIKNRLNLENFSGETLESVEQDFYSTIFVSNLETLLTEDANKELEERSKNNKNKLKVNKTVSFNTIKRNIIELFFEKDTDLKTLMKKLKNEFKQSATPIRPGRKYERKKGKTWRQMGYYKKREKHTY
jgi:hypothetical protein